MPKLQFWYDLASTYSYLSAMRVSQLAADAGVTVSWHPFLLGPIFKAQGWQSSPFNLYPAKGRYMIRDIERIAAARGLPFAMPEPFPANSLAAARLALAAGPDAIEPLTRALFLAEFAPPSHDISDTETLAAILAALELPAGVLEKSGSDPVKAELHSNTETAARLGIFGAPTFVTGDGELFWGDDRLEHAVAWAAGSVASATQPAKTALAARQR